MTKRSRFTWSRVIGIGYVLRDARGYARSAVTGRGRKYYGLVFAPDLPTSKKYVLPANAARWVHKTLLHEELVPANSEFGKLAA